MPQTSGHLEKSALIFLYKGHREHNLLKLIVKKLSPKINVKNIKNRVFFLIMCLSLVAPWLGLCSVIVAFPGHALLFLFINMHC